MPGTGDRKGWLHGPYQHCGLMRGLCTERMTVRCLEQLTEPHQREVQADRAHVAAQQLVILLEPLRIWSKPP